MALLAIAMTLLLMTVATAGAKGVSSAKPKGISPASVSPALAAPPANDAFAAAQVITGSTGTIAGSNVAATTESGEPALPDDGGASIWYSWTAPSSGVVTFDTYDSPFDTTLAVYTGNSLATLDRVAYNDDGTVVETLDSEVSFAVVSGTTYKVGVYGYPLDEGGFDEGAVTLNWVIGSATPTPGDLYGTVSSISDAAPLEGVSVTLGALAPILTDADGWYQFDSVTPGVYDVTFAKAGYVSQTIHAMSLCAGADISKDVELAPDSALMPVWRFYNFRTGTHFYTADANEKNNVAANMRNTYSLDGIGYTVNTANPDNSTWLYRFYNKKTGTHFYTADAAEKANVENNMRATYVLDGPAYKVCSTNVAGATTVWRFYNFRTGTHFYTADAAEKANVLNNMRNTYSLDGPGFFLAP